MDVLTRTVDNLQRAGRLVIQAGLSHEGMEPVALSLLLELPDLEIVLEDQVGLLQRLQEIDHMVIETGIAENLRPEAYRFAGRLVFALTPATDVDDVARNDVQPGPGRDSIDPTGGLGMLSSPGGVGPQ